MGRGCRRPSRAWAGSGDEDRLAFVTQSALKWRTEVVEAAFAAHPGPKIAVRYEDLRADPETHLRRLFEWLGLELDQALLAELVERRVFERIPAAHRGPDRFFRAASPGGWRQNLPAGEQAALAEVIGPKLRELGYPA